MMLTVVMQMEVHTLTPSQALWSGQGHACFELSELL